MAAAVGGAGPGYFVELSTQPGSNIYYAEHRLGPVDDPLPQAPESGLYFNHDGTRSASLKLEEKCIALGTNASILEVRLTPETALDLAYDLRRMAMEIKRKEKQV